jgi:hypothetical protein
MEPKALPQKAKREGALADHVFALETLEDLFSSASTERLRSSDGELRDSQGQGIGVRISEQV